MASCPPPKKFSLDRVVASPSLASQLVVDLPVPLTFCGRSSVPFSGLLEFRNKGRICLALSLTWTSSRSLLIISLAPFPLPEASSKREHLRAEILSMLGKGAIERVAIKSSPGFYSLLFVIAKKNRNLCLVIVLVP